MRYCSRSQHPALFVDMRLGKTLVTCRWIKLLSNVRKVLIVSPYSAFPAWRKEIKEEFDQEVVELTGDWINRSVKLHQFGKTFFVINKEGFQVLPLIKDKFDWDVLVLDESTFIKNPKAKVTKFFLENFRNVRHRCILTGTPAPESPLEYFSQLQFLDESIWREKNIWQFRHKWFIEAGYEWVVSKKGESYIAGRLSEYCYFLDRKEVGNLPEKAYEQREVLLPKTLRKTYETLQEELVLEYRRKEIDRTIFATQKFIWLRRLLGGLVDGEFLFKGKLDELSYLLENDLHGEQVVVWSVFHQEVDMLQSHLQNKVGGVEVVDGRVKHGDRDKRLRRFMRGKSQVLVAHPGCFKYGADFSAADVAIYYSTPLGLESRLQSEDRIVSVEKGGFPLIIDLTVADSIDEDVLQSLYNKEKSAEMLERVSKRLSSTHVSNPQRKRRRKRRRTRRSDGNRRTR